MDTIILAAGANERLRGIVAQYHKPLLVINGESLIVHNVRIGLNYTEEHGRVIIVASPINLPAIADVLRGADLLNDNVVFAIQHSLKGPLHALSLGLELASREQDLMMLCGDNYVTKDDMKKFIMSKSDDAHFTMSTNMYEYETAEQFTSITTRACEETGKTMYVFDKKSREEDYRTKEIPCWVGPVWLSSSTKHKLRQEIYDVDFSEASQDIGFEDVFNKLSSQLTLNELQFVTCAAIDVGTPGALIRKDT